MPTIELGPVSFVTRDREDFLSCVDDAVGLRRPSHFITLNALMFLAALRDGRRASLINRASCVVADSVGIAWASRMLSSLPLERLPGIDLVHALCRHSSAKGYRVFLLGAEPGIAKKAGEELQKIHPGLLISGACHGYFSPAEEAGIAAAILRARPDILLVGMAVPRQEEWIAAHLADFNVPVVMGIGGSFDVISGKLRRAPLWMQRTGLEWLFRVIQEPRRLFRIADLPVFVLAVLLLRLRRIFTRRSSLPG